MTIDEAEQRYSEWLFEEFSGIFSKDRIITMNDEGEHWLQFVEEELDGRDPYDE